MSTAPALGEAFDASIAMGEAEPGDSRLADALAEVEAAEARVVKVEVTLAAVRTSLDDANAALEALRLEGA
jgi:hypothetical protein